MQSRVELHPQPETKHHGTKDDDENGEEGRGEEERRQENAGKEEREQGETAGQVGGEGKSSRGAARRTEPKDLGDLFMETLKDIYHAEKQILRALPKMAKAAQSGELNAALSKRTRSETARPRRARSRRSSRWPASRPRRRPVDAILGLVEEGEEVMKEFKGSAALDAGPARRGASRRALRDVALRDAEELGGAARHA